LLKKFRNSANIQQSPGNFGFQPRDNATLGLSSNGAGLRWGLQMAQLRKGREPTGTCKACAHTEAVCGCLSKKKHLLGKANEYVNTECMQCNSFCWSISSASTSSFQFRNGEVAKGPYGRVVSYSSLYNSKALRSAANGRPLRYGRGHLPELQLDATGGFSTPVTHLCCH
jgi:hypothetical protein